MKGCSVVVLFWDRKEQGGYGHASFQLVQVELLYWQQLQTPRKGRYLSAYTLDVSVYTDGKKTYSSYGRIEPGTSRSDAQRYAMKLYDDLLDAHPVLGKEMKDAKQQE